MKSDSYILIQGWMVNELQLKSHSLLIFAIIYGYSKDGQGKFDGSLNYLCKSIGVTKNTVINSLNDLLEKQLILKEVVTINNINFCKYFQNDIVVQKFVWGSSNKGTVGSGIFEPNNTNNNNTKENKQILFSDCIWNDYNTLKIELAKDTSFVKDYAGVDLKSYIEDCLAWSVSKNKKSTNKGWYLTLRKWMRDAKKDGKLTMLKDFKPKVKDGHINY